MDSSVTPLVRVSSASVGWGHKTILSGVDLVLRDGDYLALVGPNGSGKSTLLRAILGLAAPLSGRVERSPRWRAGYVPQREGAAQLLGVRAAEVVAMAVPASWMPMSARARRREAAQTALSAVGMTAFAHHVYRDLSGGQRQRVMLARALASEPTVLILDEPTNGLDVGAQRDLLDLVRRLRAERGLACLLVTHSIRIARTEAETVALLHEGEMALGAPADILSEARLAQLYGARALGGVA